jgi:hypothetical protein
MELKKVVIALLIMAVVIALGSGAAATKKRREWKAYDTDEVRAKLHERFAAAGVETPSP